MSYTDYMNGHTATHATEPELRAAACDGDDFDKGRKMALRGDGFISKEEWTGTVNLPSLIQTLKNLIPVGTEIYVGKEVGLAVPTIKNWLSGKRDPRLSLFEATLNHLNHRLSVVPVDQSKSDTRVLIDKLLVSIDDDVNLQGGLTSNTTIQLTGELKMKLQIEDTKS